MFSTLQVFPSLALALTVATIATGSIIPHGLIGKYHQHRQAQYEQRVQKLQNGVPTPETEKKIEKASHKVAYLQEKYNNAQARRIYF